MPSIEASRRNLEKAKTRWRPPRPWRSPHETRVIKCLAWQWFIGEKPRCSLRELARRLGVSQTYCQKLMRQFRASPPNDLELVVRGYGGPSISASGELQEPRVRILTTFEELREAQEQSERLRAGDLLRPAHARSQRAIRTGSPAFADSSSIAAWEAWERSAKKRKPKLTGQQILERALNQR